MSDAKYLHPDRQFPAYEPVLGLARALYGEVAGLPIISPHGHTDPCWFADNTAFSDPAALFVIPDHYLLRMFRSQGHDYDALGVARHDGAPVAHGRDVWRHFCRHFHLFRGTPSDLWLCHSLSFFFGIDQPPTAETADATYDIIAEALETPEMRPLAILDRANVEVIATTESALDPLPHHQVLRDKGLNARIRTTYRPDDVTDPDNPDFTDNLARFGEMTGEDTSQWTGMIHAHAKRRAEFREFGATATDHGVPSALTCDLSPAAKQSLLDRALKGTLSPDDADMFRGQMLFEMAALSVEDGMVMQIHAGVLRSQDRALLAARGPNLGSDIPVRCDFVHGFRPLLEKFGTDPRFRLIAFTLDESTYGRELAPMAGYWPALKIGPPWWFFDSPRGMRRYFDLVVETTGFANLAGFNDDTRALLSIPARHDVWRREVCRYMAEQVSQHQLRESDALQITQYLCYQAAKDAYSL